MLLLVFALISWRGNDYDANHDLSLSNDEMLGLLKEVMSLTTLRPKPDPETRHLEPEIRNPGPGSRTLEPGIRNPKVEARNQKNRTRNSGTEPQIPDPGTTSPQESVHEAPGPIRRT